MPDTWQDVVMTVGIWIFNYGILKMARQRTALPRTTMTINLTVTTMFMAVFVTLSLWYTVASIGAQLLLWAAVAVRGREPVVTEVPLVSVAGADGTVAPVGAAPAAAGGSMSSAASVRDLDHVTAAARVEVER